MIRILDNNINEFPGWARKRPKEERNRWASIYEMLNFTFDCWYFKSKREEEKNLTILFDCSIHIEKKKIVFYPCLTRKFDLFVFANKIKKFFVVFVKL